MAADASCLRLSVVLIVGHDVSMLKAVGGTAVDLRREWLHPARLVELGVPGVERRSLGFFVVMILLGHVYLLYLVLLVGSLRGTLPGPDRAAAGSASESGQSSCKTIRYLVRGSPLAVLLAQADWQ
jgi:hypothetical protein